ncbi:MAG: 4-hydroxybenzoate octaprenyltransferase [Gammaproteobacteria bacterium]
MKPQARRTTSRSPRALQGTARWRAYARLMRLHRPIGVLLLLWPTLWALWIASGGVPDPFVLGVFVLGTVLMRSAGCVINDFADRGFDGHVARTRDRPFAVGAVGEREALQLFAVLVALSGLLVLTMNRPTILLSFAAVGLAVLYPFMKRYTYLPQVYLGAAFGWGVPMAFTATTGTLPALAWLIFCAVVVWTLVYDTEYAMVDRADDLRIGIKSTAILFGDADRGVIAALQVLLLVNLVLVGLRAELAWPYYAGLAAGAGCLAWQQVLIRTRAPKGCFAAFMNNNWFGLWVFVGIAASYLRLPGIAS